MPWGVQRYASGTVPTMYRFTGQFVESDLGIYFYQSRWYDPSLSRFIQADSIVPDMGNSQAWDRYAYVLNSPLNYVDPSGHGYCDNDNKYNAEGVSCEMTAQDILGTYYNVVFDDASEWGDENMLYVYIAVQTVGAAFVQQIFASIVGTVGEALQDVYGLSSGDQMLFEWNPKCSGCRPFECQETNSWTGDCAPAFGVTNSKHHIIFASMSSISGLRRINNVIHELGHAFNVRIGRIPENAVSAVPDLKKRPDGFFGYPGAYTWVQSPDTSPSEIFADQFIGWVYGLWGSDSIGPIRAEFMNQMNGINGWVSLAGYLP
jgi:RHS repeat-associated protein